VGLKVKEAVSAVATVTVWLDVFEPELFVTVRVTGMAPAVA
jgi:hypothetical protein